MNCNVPTDICFSFERFHRRDTNGLRIIMMCEIPSNAVLADQFLDHFHGFSIGANDMTQMTLALDRDSGLIAEGFDERDPAVKHMLNLAIQACRKAGKYVGICGQGPSDHPDLHRRLKAEAAHNHRSMTRQALALLEQALTAPARDAADLLPDPLKPVKPLTRGNVVSVIRKSRDLDKTIRSK